jgi:hypothetical protein
MMIRRTAPSRKKEFDAALRLAGMSKKDWRAKVYPISERMLFYVLNGERPGGAALNAAIDKTIRKYLTDRVAA